MKNSRVVSAVGTSRKSRDLPHIVSGLSTSISSQPNKVFLKSNISQTSKYQPKTSFSTIAAPLEPQEVTYSEVTEKSKSISAIFNSYDVYPTSNPTFDSLAHFISSSNSKELAPLSIKVIADEAVVAHLNQHTKDPSTGPRLVEQNGTKSVIYRRDFTLSTRQLTSYLISRSPPYINNFKIGNIDINSKDNANITGSIYQGTLTATDEDHALGVYNLSNNIAVKVLTAKETEQDNNSTIFVPFSDPKLSADYFSPHFTVENDRVSYSQFDQLCGMKSSEIPVSSEQSKSPTYTPEVIVPARIPMITQWSKSNLIKLITAFKNNYSDLGFTNLSMSVGDKVYTRTTPLYQTVFKSQPQHLKAPLHAQMMPIMALQTEYVSPSILDPKNNSQTPSQPDTNTVAQSLLNSHASIYDVLTTDIHAKQVDRANKILRKLIAEHSKQSSDPLTPQLYNAMIVSAFRQVRDEASTHYNHGIGVPCLKSQDLHFKGNMFSNFSLTAVGNGTFINMKDNSAKITKVPIATVTNHYQVNWMNGLSISERQDVLTKLVDTLPNHFLLGKAVIDMLLGRPTRFSLLNRRALGVRQLVAMKFRVPEIIDASKVTSATHDHVGSLYLHAENPIIELLATLLSESPMDLTAKLADSTGIIAAQTQSKQFMSNRKIDTTMMYPMPTHILNREFPIEVLMPGVITETEATNMLMLLCLKHRRHSIFFSIMNSFYNSPYIFPKVTERMVPVMVQSSNDTSYLSYVNDELDSVLFSKNIFADDQLLKVMIQRRLLIHQALLRKNSHFQSKAEIAVRNDIKSFIGNFSKFLAEHNVGLDDAPWVRGLNSAQKYTFLCSTQSLEEDYAPYLPDIALNTIDDYATTKIDTIKEISSAMVDEVFEKCQMFRFQMQDDSWTYRLPNTAKFLFQFMKNNRHFNITQLEDIINVCLDKDEKYLVLIMQLLSIHCSGANINYVNETGKDSFRVTDSLYDIASSITHNHFNADLDPEQVRNIRNNGEITLTNDGSISGYADRPLTLHIKGKGLGLNSDSNDGANDGITNSVNNHVVHVPLALAISLPIWKKIFNKMITIGRVDLVEKMLFLVRPTLQTSLYASHEATMNDFPLKEAVQNNSVLLDPIDVDIIKLPVAFETNFETEESQNDEDVEMEGFNPNMDEVLDDDIEFDNIVRSRTTQDPSSVVDSDKPTQSETVEISEKNIPDSQYLVYYSVYEYSDLSVDIHTESEGFKTSSTPLTLDQDDDSTEEAVKFDQLYQGILKSNQTGAKTISDIMNPADMLKYTEMQYNNAITQAKVQNKHISQFINPNIYVNVPLSYLKKNNITNLINITDKDKLIFEPIRDSIDVTAKKINELIVENQALVTDELVQTLNGLFGFKANDRASNPLYFNKQTLYNFLSRSFKTDYTMTDTLLYNNTGITYSRLLDDIPKPMMELFKAIKDQHNYLQYNVNLYNYHISVIHTEFLNTQSKMFNSYNDLFQKQHLFNIRNTRTKNKSFEKHMHFSEASNNRTSTTARAKVRLPKIDIDMKPLDNKIKNTNPNLFLNKVVKTPFPEENHKKHKNKKNDTNINSELITTQPLLPGSMLISPSKNILSYSSYDSLMKIHSPIDSYSSIVNMTVDLLVQSGNVSSATNVLQHLSGLNKNFWLLQSLSHAATDQFKYASSLRMLSSSSIDFNSTNNTQENSSELFLNSEAIDFPTIEDYSSARANMLIESDIANILKTWHASSNNDVSYNGSSLDIGVGVGGFANDLDVSQIWSKAVVANYQMHQLPSDINISREDLISSQYMDMFTSSSHFDHYRATGVEWNIVLKSLVNTSIKLIEDNKPHEMLQLVARVLFNIDTHNKINPEAPLSLPLDNTIFSLQTLPPKTFISALSYVPPSPLLTSLETLIKLAADLICVRSIKTNAQKKYQETLDESQRFHVPPADLPSADVNSATHLLQPVLNASAATVASQQNYYLQKDISQHIAHALKKVIKNITVKNIGQFTSLPPVEINHISPVAMSEAMVLTSVLATKFTDYLKTVSSESKTTTPKVFVRGLPLDELTDELSRVIDASTNSILSTMVRTIGVDNFDSDLANIEVNIITHLPHLIPDIVAQLQKSLCHNVTSLHSTDDTSVSLCNSLDLHSLIFPSVLNIIIQNEERVLSIIEEKRIDLGVLEMELDDIFKRVSSPVFYDLKKTYTNPPSRSTLITQKSVQVPVPNESLDNSSFSWLKSAISIPNYGLTRLDPSTIFTAQEIMDIALNKVHIDENIPFLQTLLITNFKTEDKAYNPPLTKSQLTDILRMILWYGENKKPEAACILYRIVCTYGQVQPENLRPIISSLITLGLNANDQKKSLWTYVHTFVSSPLSLPSNSDLITKVIINAGGTVPKTDPIALPSSYDTQLMLQSFAFNNDANNIKNLSDIYQRISGVLSPSSIAGLRKALRYTLGELHALPTNSAPYVALSDFKQWVDKIDETNIIN